MTAAPSPAAARAGAGRPRRWWVAFLLNLLLPPAGYAYAGSWLTAAVAGLLIVVVPVMGLVATSAFPPGVYALGLDGLMALGVVAGLALAGHAAWMTRGAPSKSGSRIFHAGLYVFAWTAAFGANLLLRGFWPNPSYEVMSSSMSPTLAPGDIVLVDRPRALCGARALKAGQVVLYRRPGQPSPYFHRIVAGPGQIVSLDAGRLSVDGQPVAQRAAGQARLPDTAAPATLVDETLPGGATYRTADLGPDGLADTRAPARVPAGTWFLLGDNRDNAMDSRLIGPVPERDICAVAQKIIATRDMSRVGQVL